MDAMIRYQSFKVEIKKINNISRFKRKQRSASLESMHLLWSRSRTKHWNPVRSARVQSTVLQYKSRLFHLN